MFFLSPIKSIGQAYEIGKGTTFVSARFGTLNTVFGGGIPVYTNIDIGVAENYTIGPVYASFSGLLINNFTVNYSTFAVRGNYRFSRMLGAPDELDVYGGIALGYNHLTLKNNVIGAVNDQGLEVRPFYFGMQFGANYFLTSRFAANVEFIFKYDLIALGLTYKLKGI